MTWVNQDDIGHTVTSGTPASPGGTFDATLAGTGSTTTVTFAPRGVYPYFCSRHQAMRGEIRAQRNARSRGKGDDDEAESA